MAMPEVMIAMVIMTVCVYLLSSTITATIMHSDSARETVIACRAAGNLLERMRHEPFEDLFALYNAAPADDPGGVGTAPGRNFDVPELTSLPTDADGLVGEVILPAAGLNLFEDLQIPEFDLPRDLNGDIVVDAADHSGDYVILPVKVRLQWIGKAGRRNFEMYTSFVELEKPPSMGG